MWLTGSVADCTRFTCDLNFKSGRITGKADSAFGSFDIMGEYKTVAPFNVKIDLLEAFGMHKVAFVGYHAANNTLFGTWTSEGTLGGDLWFGYKQLSPGNF